MPIQYKFFSIPVNYETDAEAELNAFLRTIRLINIHRELVCQENKFYWAVAVEYTTGAGKDERKSIAARKKIDYKEVLKPEDFAIFAKLREWRKETAAREAVPVYTVFMNEQLASIVKKKITTKKGLREIDGVGDARVEKYGDAVLTIAKEEFMKLEKRDETGKKSVPVDSDT